MDDDYVMVSSSTPQVDKSESFLSRLSTSMRKMIGRPLHDDSGMSPAGMELMERGEYDGGKSGYNSPVMSPEDPQVDLTPVQDTNSEIFTSPADTPRTPNDITPIREARGRAISLNSMKRFSRVYTEDELRLKAEIESKREEKWKGMLESWIITSTFRRQVLKRRIRKGIPNKYRSEVWQKILNMEDLKIWFPAPKTLDTASLPPHVLSNIEKDLPRTYPNDSRFSEENGDGQQSLRRVLQWYAAYDPTVNYCQGMSFVAALLLTQLQEVEAYYCFVAIMHKKSLRTLYLPGLFDLMRKTYVLDKLVQEHLPKVHEHMRSQGVQVCMFCTEWIMTLFSRAFEEELACRTLEIFIFEGYKIVYRISLSLLKALEKQILASVFDGVMSAIRELPDKISTEKVLIDCFHWTIRRADLVRYEKEFEESDEGQAAAAAARIREKKEEQRRNSWTDLPDHETSPQSTFSPSSELSRPSSPELQDEDHQPLS